MAYKAVTGTRTADIELDGSVYTVKFECSYNYYAVRNDSAGTIYVSTADKSCTPGNDGVISIPSGGGYVHNNGFGGSAEIYILGSGSALIIAQDDASCPFFNPRQKGGDYTLPIASEETLGGVKSGGDISVSDSGGVTVNSVGGKTVKSNVPVDAKFTDTVYTLPIASQTELGGVKIDGTTITVDKNGVISANGYYIQAGTANVPIGGTTVTFPVAYNSAPIIIVQCSGGTGNNRGVNYNNVTRTSVRFTIVSRDSVQNPLTWYSSSGTINWIAFGKI